MDFADELKALGERVFKITIIASIFVVFLLCIAGCGGSDNKKEVQAMHDKYIILINQTLLTGMSETDKMEDWSKELADHSKKYATKFQDIANQIENEKVNEKAKFYKNYLKEYALAYAQLFDLAGKEIEYDLQKKPESEIKKIHEQATIAQKNLSQKYYEAENELSKFINNRPATVMGINGINYLAYTSSNVDIAVMDVNIADKIGNGYNETKPIGKFAIIKVFVKNNQKDAITVDSNSFKIIDNQGREYSSSVHGQTAYDLEHNTQVKGFLTQLNPNMSTDFTFIFDVPKELTIKASKLQATGGIKGKKMLLPLFPVKITTVKQ